MEVIRSGCGDEPIGGESVTGGPVAGEAINGDIGGYGDILISRARCNG